MTGEISLFKILAELEITQRDGTYCFVSTSDLDPTVDLNLLLDGPEASVVEPEGVTLVVSTAIANEAGVAYEFEAAWLTVNVHTDLESVGLTAALATELSRRQIPCNVIAGFYHDHLLVPATQAEQAISTLNSLRGR